MKMKLSSGNAWKKSVSIKQLYNKQLKKRVTIGINFSTESIKERDKVHPKGLRV